MAKEAPKVEEQTSKEPTNLKPWKPPFDRKVVFEGNLTRRGNEIASLSFFYKLLLQISVCVGFIFKKFRREFVSLESDGEILYSYKDETCKGTNHVLQLSVSFLL